MTELTRAVQAIQALIIVYMRREKLPTDAEIEQVLRETMPQPTLCLHEINLNSHCETCFKVSLGTNQREMPSEPALPESPLRERLDALVEFWRDKHTTGGIPWGDVADLLKDNGEAARKVVLSDAGHVRTAERNSLSGERDTAGTDDVDVGSSPTFSTNSESAPPKGDVAPDMCYACKEPITEAVYGVGKQGKIHWHCYDKLFPQRYFPKVEAPAEPVAQPQESIEAHQPIECRSRYCAQHRDIWRHYEDVIAKAVQGEQANPSANPQANPMSSPWPSGRRPDYLDRPSAESPAPKKKEPR